MLFNKQAINVLETAMRRVKVILDFNSLAGHYFHARGQSSCLVGLVFSQRNRLQTIHNHKIACFDVRQSF